MARPTRFAGVAALATGVALALPGGAGAKAGDRSFQQTFPVASQLCANVAAGKGGKRLKRFASRVLAQCATLESTFTTAQSAVLAARAALTPQIAADRAVIVAACPTPTTPSAACLQARAVNKPAIKALRRQLVRAAHRYYRTIEAARLRFWRAIRALPGERHVHADAPIAEHSD
jgi:hypothetical protein